MNKYSLIYNDTERHIIVFTSLSDQGAFDYINSHYSNKKNLNLYRTSATSSAGHTIERDVLILTKINGEVTYSHPTEKALLDKRIDRQWVKRKQNRKDEIKGIVIMTPILIVVILLLWPFLRIFLVWLWALLRVIGMGFGIFGSCVGEIYHDAYG